MKILLKIENFQIGKVIERLNRFVVKVRIKNKIILAHLNNTGRLEDFIKKGEIALLLPIKNKNKLKFRLSMIKEEKGCFSIIDTLLQMKCFEIALEKGYISWLKGAKILKRNFKLNNSLFDYLIEYENKKYFLEIKSAIMKYKNFAMYPDCPSLRGQKHIRDLIKHSKKSIILFIAGMKNINSFIPNKNADPKIYELLKIAKEKGVKIKAIQIYFDKKSNNVILKNDNLPISF